MCSIKNYMKFLRTPFLQNTSGRLLLKLSNTKAEGWVEKKRCLKKKRVFYFYLNCRMVQHAGMFPLFNMNLFSIAGLEKLSSVSTVPLLTFQTSAELESVSVLIITVSKHSFKFRTANYPNFCKELHELFLLQNKGIN